MRYQDYDSADDEYDVRYNISKSTIHQEKLSDDYEFLENYDFISHLESSGVLNQHRDKEGLSSDKQDIYIDLNFMQEPSFYKEIENIAQLNSNLENELVELEDTLTTQSNPQKKMYPIGHRRFGASVVICSLIAIVFILAGGYFISLKLRADEATYAFNGAAATQHQGDLSKLEQLTDKTDLEIESELVSDKTGNEMDQQVETSSTEGSGSGATTKENIASEPTGEKTKDVAKDFDGVLFIGNSLVVGLKQNCKLPGASFYACQSLNIRDAFDMAFVRGKTSSKKLTILEALQTKQYRKIYLLFGINELGWPYSNIFIEEYQKFIEEVRELQPEATIYVQSILPVAQSRSKKQPVFAKKNVVEHNKLIKEMCSNVNVIYLNVYKGLQDSKGYLPEEYSADGIHLRVSGYEKWLAYLSEESYQ